MNGCKPCASAQREMQEAILRGNYIDLEKARPSEEEVAAELAKLDAEEGEEAARQAQAGQAAKTRRENDLEVLLAYDYVMLRTAH